MNTAPNPESTGLRPFPENVAGQRIARVYAEALLRAVQPSGQVEAVLGELDSLIDDVFGANPQVEEFLASAVVSRRHKTEFLESAFRPQASELFYNFLLVVNEHDRLDLLPAIRREYREMYEEQANHIRVFVFTATPLPDDQRERLREELRNHFRKEPALELKVRPELLGGMVVLVGSSMFDGSVRSRLQRLRNQLIESSNHEIQSRRDRFSTDGTD
jgi:F-type H+-transporting ATPase subunit delta